MAEEEQAPDNPFLGMGFGAAVRKLRDNPDLAGKFDEVFKDEQDVDTLERARLSHVNSLYRQSTTGALALKGMHDVATSPQPEEISSTPEQQSFDRWAQRLAQGTQRNKEYVPVTKKSQWEDIKKQYDSTLDDLANYDRMSNSIGALTPEGFIDPWASEAAILGSLSGGLVAIENTAFLPLKGLTPLARVVSGAIQGGVVNAATDPIVQKLNQEAGVQGEWDYTRSALSFPMGAVINGGIVGMGEVLTRNVIKSERANLAKSDPSLTEPSEIGVVAPKSEFAPGSKVDDKPLFPKEETPTEVNALKEGETLPAEIPETVARQPGGLRARSEVNVTEQTERGGREGKFVKFEIPEIGTMTTQIEGNVLTVSGGSSFVKEESRGQGYGTAMYERAVQWAEEHNLTFHSDYNPSPEAMRVYEGLKKKGYEVTEIPFTKEKSFFEIKPPSEGVVARQPGGLRAEPTPSPNYQRPPETVKSLQTMVGELEDAFGVPIRQGRVGVNGALGTFHRDTGVIHVQEYPDFSVSAHEVAHALDERLGGALSKTKGDLNTVQQQFANELRPLDYDQDPIMGQRVHEGFAEFMRLYMTNPAYVQRNAPGFYSTFSNLIERTQPEVLEKLVGFQKAYKNYLESTPEQIIAAGIVTPKRGFGEALVEKLTDQKVPPTVRNIMSLGYDAIVHKEEDFYRAFREMASAVQERNGGKLVDILPSENPTYQFEMLKKSSQTAMNHLINGVPVFGTTDPVGPSLAQALTTAVGKPSLTGQWNTPMFDKFSAYVKALMGVVRWTQHDHGLIPNAPFVESKEYFKQLVLQYNKEFPQFQQAALMLNEYNKNVRERAKDAGVYGFTSDKVDEWNKLPFYAPMYRDRSDIQPGATSGLKGAPSGPKQFQGSMRDVINPISSIITDNVSIERSIAHNRVMNSLSDLAERGGSGGGKFIEPLPAHVVEGIKVDLSQVVKTGLKEEGYGAVDSKLITEDFIRNFFGTQDPSSTAFKSVVRDNKAEPIVFWGKDGELKAARVITKEEGFGLYEILTSSPKPIEDIGIKTLGMVSQVITAGVTSNPFYALRNLFRDQFGATAFIKGYNPISGIIQGAKSVATDDKFMQAYRELGGTNVGTQFAPKSEAVQADIEALGKQGFTVRKLFSWSGIAEAVSVSEKITRMGATRAVFNEKKKMGLSDYDALLTAVRESTDLLDWGRYGSRMEAVRQVTPFFTSYVASLDKASRMMITPIKRWLTGDQVLKTDSEETQRALRAWFTLGVAGTGYGFLHAAIFSGNAAYDNAGSNATAGNFIFPIGDNVLMLPKPWELAMGFTAGEYMYKGLLQSDPRAAGQFVEAAWDSLKPSAPFWSNPMIKTTSELISNYNTFTGRPIVSEQWAGVAPEYQARGRTSEVAKRLSRATGLSPIKIDYAINGYLGYWGKDITMLSKGDEQQDPTSNLMDWALLRAGIKDPTMISDAREKFWQHMGKTTGDYAQAVNTFRMLRRSEKGEQEALSYFNKLPNNRKAWVVLNEGADEEGKKAFSADDRRAHALNRSADAVSVLNGVRNELGENRFVNGESKDILMTPDTRKKLAQVVGQMALAEMINGLIVTREPGYDKKPLFDMSVFMDKIKSLSPEAAEEVKSRYAGGSTSGKKIYRWDNVAKAYDPMQSALITNGSQADLSLITEDVTSGGYEFGSERRKKAPVRRGRIEVR